MKAITPPRHRIAPPVSSIADPPARRVPNADIGAARCLADAGRLQEAEAWCNADLIERGPSSETYYLLGLVCDASGDRERAGVCYQKAIYLQPEHVEALTHMALLMEGQGDLGAAGRLHERARRIEYSCPRVS